MPIARNPLALHAALCLLLLGGVGVHRASTRTPHDTGAYHARVKSAVESVPLRIGAWVGEEMPAPPAATALLKPNALQGRRYRAPDGRVITLAVIHCRDTRDMAGHYPPICYPAHGWTLVQSELIPDIDPGDDRRLPASRYLFERSSALTRSEQWVYNILLLPDRGGVDDMPDVRAAAASPQARNRGAAQIQLVLSGDVPEADQVRFVREFLTALRPLVRDIVQFEPLPGG